MQLLTCVSYEKVKLSKRRGTHSKLFINVTLQRIKIVCTPYLKFNSAMYFENLSSQINHLISYTQICRAINSPTPQYLGKHQKSKYTNSNIETLLLDEQNKIPWTLLSLVWLISARKLWRKYVQVSSTRGCYLYMIHIPKYVDQCRKAF